MGQLVHTLDGEFSHLGAGQHQGLELGQILHLHRQILGVIEVQGGKHSAVRQVQDRQLGKADNGVLFHLSQLAVFSQIQLFQIAG